MLSQLVPAASGFTFHITPSARAPGASGLQQVIDVGAEYALIACGIAFVASLAIMGLSKGAHLERLSAHGKEGIIVSAIIAFLVGASATILNFAYSIG